MTADEWNAKHPIGTRVLIKNGVLHEAGFTFRYARSDFPMGVEGIEADFNGYAVPWWINCLEPISAYPGDMYSGKPLKKVRND